MKTDNWNVCMIHDTFKTGSLVRDPVPLKIKRKRTQRIVRPQMDWTVGGPYLGNTGDYYAILEKARDCFDEGQKSCVLKGPVK